MTTGVVYQHGDVLLKQVDQEKYSYQLERASKTSSNRHVIMEGEGHHVHTIVAEKTDVEISIYDFGSIKMVHVPQGVLATVNHEKVGGGAGEHGTRVLPPGLYQVEQVREFDPLSQQARYVAD